MIIISIVILLIVYLLLRDLHIEVYNNGYRYVKINEYKFKYRIWHIIVILLFSFIPVINIIAFIGFLIYYIVHCFWDPTGSEKTHVFYSKKISFITKLLNKEI